MPSYNERKLQPWRKKKNALLHKGQVPTTHTERDKRKEETQTNRTEFFLEKN
jgi:hypothetical protein